MTSFGPTVDLNCFLEIEHAGGEKEEEDTLPPPPIATVTEACSSAPADCGNRTPKVSMAAFSCTSDTVDMIVEDDRSATKKVEATMPLTAALQDDNTTDGDYIRVAGVVHCEDSNHSASQEEPNVSLLKLPPNASMEELAHGFFHVASER